STPLVEITTHQYKAWKNSLEATYSANYVRDILKVFGMLMDDADDHRPPLLPASPVPKVNRRRGRFVPKPREKKNVV
ncbi:hypothetical protein KBZ21_46290, partial [Streptomyces sp. A73]|nr:hypothetical protein [Streptomyces sp. A73]